MKKLLLLSILIFCFPCVAYGATNVYFSVGQSTSTDLKTGSPTINISGNIGTFSTAQIGNIGVGDQVIYDGGTAYISGKVDNSNWNLVLAAGGTPPSTTSKSVTSIKRSFSSLSTAESGIDDLIGTSNLVTGSYIVNIPCYYDTGPDTTAVTIDGWTTGIENYIKIYTPNNTSTESNYSQRHSGKWEAGKYRLEITSASSSAITVSDNDVIIDGLQVMSIAPEVITHDMISIDMVFGDVTGVNVQITNNILRGTQNVSERVWFEGISDYNSNRNGPEGTVKIFNNLIFDYYGYTKSDSRWTHSIGIEMTYLNFYIYNNTIQNCGLGLFQQNDALGLDPPIAQFASAKNNITQDCQNGFRSDSGVSFDASSDYNISDIAGDTNDVSNSYRKGLATRVSFVDRDNDDFHLAFADTAARESGVDLSGDTYPISTDIDGHTRPTLGNWDIGADEGASHVFYSVGQSSSDLKSGSPTVNITGNGATFSVAQTGDIGVGDQVIYTGGTAYISGKIDTSNWNLILKTGGTPPPATNASVISIKRAYDSLYAAEAGIDDNTNVGIGTTNLFTGNFVVNIPCYGNSLGTADTTAVMVNGWTTAANNYLKIYTPNNTSTEANFLQRHSGKWDDFKYHRDNSGSSITIDDAGFTRIDGLQIYAGIGASVSNGIRYYGDDSDFGVGYFSNNIVKSNTSNDNGYGIWHSYSPSNKRTMYAYNNIVYDFSSSSGYGFGSNAGSKSYYYNNIAYNCGIGFDGASDGSTVAKNNISYNGPNGNALAYNIFPYHSSSTNNLVGPLGVGLSMPQANAQNGVTVSFVSTNSGSEDFHLAPADTSARGNGIGLSRDPYLNFSQDIDGQDRAGNWDIGADQFIEGHLSSTHLGLGANGTGIAIINSSQTDKLKDSLVGMWSFDGPDISGTAAIDGSGNGHNGMIVGATPAMGKIGQAMSFNATSGSYYVDAGDINELDGIPKLTLSVWFYRSSADDLLNIEKGTSNINQLGINVNPNIIYFNIANGAVSAGEFTYSGTGWFHLTMVYDGTQTGNDNRLKAYFDGSPLTLSWYGTPDNDIPATTDVNSANFLMGWANNYHVYSTGLIDEVRVYNRALSTEEVKALYNMGKATLRE